MHSLETFYSRQSSGILSGTINKITRTAATIATILATTLPPKAHAQSTSPQLSNVESASSLSQHLHPDLAGATILLQDASGTPLHTRESLVVSSDGSIPLTHELADYLEAHGSMNFIAHTPHWEQI